MVSGASEGVDRRLSCFVFFLVIWDVLEYFKFEKESRAPRTKSHPAVGSEQGYRSARRAL